MWVFSPDFSQVAQVRATSGCALNAGQDGAWWMAVNHVLLKEFHHERQVPYFLDYTKRYTDAPFLVELTRDGDGTYRPGSCCAPNRLAAYAGVENGEWKFLMWDAADGRPQDADGQRRLPLGQSRRASGT